MGDQTTTVDTPYYDEGGVTLYHGRAEAVLAGRTVPSHQPIDRWDEWCAHHHATANPRST